MRAEVAIKRIMKILKDTDPVSDVICLGICVIIFWIALFVTSNLIRVIDFFLFIGAALLLLRTLRKMKEF